MSKRISPAEFLAKELELGISPDNPRFVSSTEKTCIKFQEGCKAAKIDIENMSFIDFGAGTGVYAETFRKNGFEIKALDIWKPHRDFMKERYPDLEVIAKPVKSDVMLFIEVAEHMTDEQIVNAVSAIDPEIVLFSSTSKHTDYDDEWGHINLKPQPEWVEFWKMLGYQKAIDVTKPTKWSFILKRI